MTHLDEKGFEIITSGEKTAEETRDESRKILAQEVKQTEKPYRTTHEINSSLFKSDMEIDTLFKEIDSLTLEQIDRLYSLLVNSLDRPEYKDEELKNERAQLVACIGKIESLTDRKAAAPEFKSVLEEARDLHKKFHAPERSLRYE